MNSVVDTDRDSKTELASLRRGLPDRLALPLLLAALLGASSGCSSDEGDGNAGTGGTSGDGGPMGSGGQAASGDPEFDACIAAVTPLCRTSELDTEEEMESSCMATEFISIPLTSGGTHGPVTIDGGPYGGRVDWNEGAGTEFVNAVNMQEAQCNPTLIDVFAEPAAATDDLKNTRGLDHSLYTIFRPACMKQGETYPVITWANGTCGFTHGYALLLGAVASHGYVVVASNSTWTNTAPTNGVQLRALDYAASLNEDSSHVLYQRLDLSKIGAMGHSQGAAATAVAASDSRVKSIILWNGGVSNVKPFLNVSGDRDIGNPMATALESETNAATQPGAWAFYHQILETGGNFTGHLVLMEQPERVWEMTVAWWDWQLKGDQTAKPTFIGDACDLCNRDAEFEYGHNSLLQ